MFKIGDFSRLSFVTVKALRYYDEIGLLKPVKVDQFTGYRYYSADQLPRLNHILALKDLGLSLDEIALLVKDGLSPAQMRAIFILKKADLAQRVADEQKRLERVERLLQQLEKEGTMPNHQITIKKVEPMLVAGIRAILPTFAESGPLFGEIYSYVMPKGGRPAGAPMMLYHQPEYQDHDVDLEVALPLEKTIKGSERVKVYELAGAEVADTVHKGAYNSVGGAYNDIMAWCEANNYQPAGPCREIYLTNPNDLDDPAKNVTEIQMPVKKAG